MVSVIGHVYKPGSLFGAAPALSPCNRAPSLGLCCSARCGSAAGTSESIALTAHLTRCARLPPGAWQAQTLNYNALSFEGSCSSAEHLKPAVGACEIGELSQYDNRVTVINLHVASVWSIDVCSSTCQPPGLLHLPLQLLSVSCSQCLHSFD